MISRLRHARILLASGFAVALMPATGAAAEEARYIGNSERAFQARVRAVVDGQHYSGRLYHRYNMQRQEFDGEGGGRVRIVRFDHGVVWTLDMNRRRFTEDRLSEAALDIGVLDRRGVRLAERESGLRLSTAATLGPVARYVFAGTLPHGGPVSGSLWLTRGNILVRAEGVSRIAGRRYSYRYELSEIRLGEQPMSRFVIPAGFERIDRRPFWGIEINHPQGAVRIEEQSSAGTSQERGGAEQDRAERTAPDRRRARHEGRFGSGTTQGRDEDPTSLESFFRDNE